MVVLWRSQNTFDFYSLFVFHITVCSFGTFNCRNPDDFLGDNCLAYSKVCDGIDDCYNGTDEAFCGGVYASIALSTC